jgi:parallel beta-helix repeat protein
VSWKKISIVILVLGLLSIMAAPTAVAAQTELHVGTGYPYADIEDAMDVAGEGDTITVHTGTYSELVYIDVNNLTFRGEGAILDGTTLTGLNDGLVTVLSGVHGVTIEGFEIRNFEYEDHGGNGIWIQGDSFDNTVRNNTIHDVNGAGVFMGEGSTGNIISNNYFYVCENGVGANDSHSNQIVGNTTESNNIGIFLGNGCSGNLVMANEDIDSNVSGINLGGVINNLIVGNQIDGAFEGIWIGTDEFNSGSQYNLIMLNTILADQVGIILGNTTHNWLIGNTITGLDPENTNGIFLGKDHSLVAANTNVISGNNISSCRNGVKLMEGASLNQIINNRITGMYLDGIVIIDSNDNSAEGNSISKCFRGIALLRACNNTILDNRVSNITQNGIYLRLLSDNNTVEGNRVSNCHNGIFIWDSHNSQISGNAVNNSEDWGIAALEGSSGNTITENRVINSGDYDLYDTSDLNTWENNKYKKSNFYSYPNPSVFNIN